LDIAVALLCKYEATPDLCAFLFCPKFADCALQVISEEGEEDAGVLAV